MHLLPLLPQDFFVVLTLSFVLELVCEDVLAVQVLLALVLILELRSPRSGIVLHKIR